jgi:hypothetical protein
MGALQPARLEQRSSWIELKDKPAEAELTWAQVHAFRLGRHHLEEPAPKSALVKVSGEIGGLQAQVMSAAEMQIGVRVYCRATDVRERLWKDRTLVKTWLMRGTLHLVPAVDLPLYTAAMSTRWIRTRSTWLRFLGMSEPELLKLVEAIGEALDGAPKTREEVVAKVGRGRSERVHQVLRSGWGGMLKPVARNGLLCFGPNRGQSVTFVRPEQWLGRWRHIDPEEALVEVARRYLRAYGPATRHDFARWWGNWAGVGTAAWAGLAGELAPVSVEGRRADVLATDLGAVTGARPSGSIRLLPQFDPYLMGHAGRGHLVEAVYAPRVSRVAGWISAVVLVDGRVAGTWTHVVARQMLHVTVEPFGRINAKTLAEVRRHAESLARSLGLAAAAVKVA